MDYWPQATHLIDEPSRLVLCATGGGGGSQPAMFRSHLDPLLWRAHQRWRDEFDPSAPAAAELDRLFSLIDREFEELTNPHRAAMFTASAAALLVGDVDSAVANVGVERAWALRGQRLERLSRDDSLGALAGDSADALPEFLRDAPASRFGRLGGAPGRWRVQQITTGDGDLFLLASGFGDTGPGEAVLAAELTRACDADESSPGTTAAQGCARVAELLGERLVSLAAGHAGEKARWFLHSRVALAVVRLTAAG